MKELRQLQNSRLEKERREDRIEEEHDSEEVQVVGDQAHTSHFTLNTCIAYSQKKMQLKK